MADLARRLAGPAGARPLLLDGATGTELERRGVPSTLPLWSAHALLERPDVVEAIHRDYVAAGAELLTANTFRTQRRTLARAGCAERAAELTRRAVERARAAAREPGHTQRVWVAGSAPPLEDCYRPDLVPDDAACEREHREHAEHLAAAGVDVILVETHNTLREARAALREARATGLPVLASVIADADARLPSGEPLAEVCPALAELEPLALLVNCLPPAAVPACLDVLAGSVEIFGVYANLGPPGADAHAPRGDDCTPDEFARHAQAWVDRGARLVGGCCGTRPAHIAAVAASLTHA